MGARFVSTAFIAASARRSVGLDLSAADAFGARGAMTTMTTMTNMIGLLPPHAAVMLLKAAFGALAHHLAVKALLAILVLTNLSEL